MNKKLKWLTGVITVIIPVILSLIIVIQSDNIVTWWKLTHGDALFIDFHEESLYNSDTGNYARIDVYNNLPTALTYLKGNVAFICNGMNKTIVTDTFDEKIMMLFWLGKLPIC